MAARPLRMLQHPPPDPYPQVEYVLNAAPRPVATVQLATPTSAYVFHIAHYREPIVGVKRAGEKELGGVVWGAKGREPSVGAGGVGVAGVREPSKVVVGKGTRGEPSGGVGRVGSAGGRGTSGVGEGAGFGEKSGGEAGGVEAFGAGFVPMEPTTTAFSEAKKGGGGGKAAGMPQGGGGGVEGVASGQPQSTFKPPTPKAEDTAGGIAAGHPYATFEPHTPKADDTAGGVAAGRSAAKENATGANAPCPHPVLFRGPAHLSGSASGNITVTRFVNSRAVNTCSVAAQAENACGGALVHTDMHGVNSPTVNTSSVAAQAQNACGGALVHMDMRGVNNLAVNSGGGAAAAENASAGGGGEVAAAPPHEVYSGQHAVYSGQHEACSGLHTVYSGPGGGGRGEGHRRGARGWMPPALAALLQDPAVIKV